MFKLALIVVLATTLMQAAEGGSAALLASAGSNGLRGASGTPNRVDLTLFAGDTVLPQVANGGGFEMIFFVSNHTSNRVTVSISFRDDTGIPLPLPVYDPLTLQRAGVFPALQGTVAPFGTSAGGTFGVGEPLRTGYAVIESNPSESVSVTAVYIQNVPGRPPFQAAVPISNRFHERFFMPFVNAIGLTMAVAIVNATSFGAPVTMIARDLLGVEMCRSSRTFSPNEHQAFVLSDVLSCTSGRAGGLEVRAGGLGVGAIGFIFQDFGAFTTVFPTIQFGR